jgi:fibronectin-binding autotransporter adhesin
MDAIRHLKRAGLIVAVIAPIVLVVCSQQVMAQDTVTWKTGTSSVLANWSSGALPGATDTVAVNIGNWSPYLNSNLNIKGWTWGDNGNGYLYFLDGGSLTIDGGSGTVASTAGVKGVIVWQTNASATLIHAAAFGGRGLTVVSNTSTATANFNIQSGLAFNASHGSTGGSFGVVGVATTADRNGTLTVSGSLTGANTISLGATTGSGTAKLVIDGGFVASGVSLAGAAGGNSSVLFKSGTLSRTSGGTLQISNANANLLDIALGSNGTRVLDAGGLVVAMPTVRFVDETTAGSLTKAGANTLVLQAANTYTGDTVISSGTLRVENVAQQVLSGTVGGSGNKVISGLASTAGLFIGQAVTGSGITANSYITVITGTSVTVSGSGTPGAVSASFSAANGTLQGTTLNYDNQGGVLSFGQSTALTLGGLKGSQNLALTNANSAGVTLTLGGNTQSTSYSGVLSGAGSMTKVGAGDLTLGGANTFGGSLAVSEGSLSIATINNASANGTLGNSASAVVLGSAGKVGTLAYTGATASSNKPFTAAAGGTATFTVADAAATLTLSGLIGGDGDKSFGGPGSIVASGGISGGSSNVFKTGTGALTLAGASGHANTTVSQGRLNVNYFSALGTAAGTLSMAAGTTLDNTSGGKVGVTNGKSIALGSSLNFLGSSSLDLGPGTVTLSGSTAIDVAANTLTFSGDVVGPGYGLLKNGAGVLELAGLSGGSSFTGNSFINAGELYLSGNSVLGGGSNTTVTVADGAFLRVGASASLGGATVVSRPGGLITATVVNANQTFDQSGTLTSDNANFNGVQTIRSGVTISAAANDLGTIPASPTAGRIVIENGATLRATEEFHIAANQGISLVSGTGVFSVDASKALFIESAVAGSGGIRKVGAGNVRLTGSNSFTGGTVIEQGIVGITTDASLGDVTGRLKLDGGTIVAAQTVSGGTVSGATIDSGRQVVLANGKTSGMHAQTGLTLRYDGAIGEENGGGAAANLTFGATGAREGTVILGGANIYRGTTTVAAGTLVVNGSLGQGNLIVDAGATLKGSGVINGLASIQGIHSPGNSPGLETFTNGLSYGSSSTLVWELSANTAELLDRGTLYDGINLTSGTLSIDPGAKIDLVFNAALAGGGASTVDWDDPFWASSRSWKVIDVQSGLWSGGVFTLNSIGTDASGQSLSSSVRSNAAFSLSQNTTGVYVQYVIVPEPATVIFAGIGIAMVGWSLRRRCRNQTGG